MDKKTVPRGGICGDCFRADICFCNRCKCQHSIVGSEYVCDDNFLFMERRKGKGAMLQSHADRIPVRVESRVLRFGSNGSFNDELKSLREQVARLTLENQELRNFKAAAEAKATEAKGATDA